MSDIFVKENIIRTEEHFSPSRKYRLVIETYRTHEGYSNYTKGTVYSCCTGEWVGEIQRNYSIFPFLFFQKGQREYLISGRTYTTSHTIINCETGHIYDNTDENENKDELCWSQMWQIDERTLCVLGCYWGGSYFYSFFDLSNLNCGCKILTPICLDGKSLPKHYYNILTNNNDDEKNYPHPYIKNGEITFVVRETRIYGIGIRGTDIKEMDLLYHDYKEQLKEDGYRIPFAEDKKYYVEMVRMSFRRQNDNMVMTDFWRDIRQIMMDNDDIDTTEKIIQKSSIMYLKIEKILQNKFPNYTLNSYHRKNRCQIFVIPDYTKSFCYRVEFSYEEGHLIKVTFVNWKFPCENVTLKFWNEDFLKDMM